MAIGKAARHNSDHEDESDEESDEGSSGDESYDYGFVGDDNEEDEQDSDYEVDYSSMNVSPEILRMLGASEEVIAAKEAEVSGVTSTWVPPTETGLEHSAAIADSSAVAIGPGGAAAGGGVERVFKAIGSFDKEIVEGGAAAEDGPVMKVKVVHGLEPVPKELESKLPPQSEGSGSDDDSDFSWDEESVIDGHAWWEVGSQDEELEVSTMSPNLQSILGLAKPSDGVNEGDGGGDKGDWRPPSSSGLDNSKPIRTLTPLVVGQNKGLQVQYKKKRQEGDGDGSQQEDGDEDWSEEEGWDYEDVPDEDYVLDWSTSISPNLAKAMGRRGSATEKVEALSAELSWKPPASSGLKNSAPLIDPARLYSQGKRLC